MGEQAVGGGGVATLVDEDAGSHHAPAGVVGRESDVPRVILIPDTGYPIRRAQPGPSCCTLCGRTLTLGSLSPLLRALESKYVSKETNPYMSIDNETDGTTNDTAVTTDASEAPAEDAAAVEAAPAEPTPEAAAPATDTVEVEASEDTPAPESADEPAEATAAEADEGGVAVVEAPRGERPAISAPTDIGDVPDDLSADDFAAAVEQTVFEFKEGDIVAGTVVRVDPDEVLVDIGYKSEGVIPPYELSVRNNTNPSEIVSVGDEIEALVLQKEDDQGRLVLSKKRAQYERAWGRIEKLMNEGGTVSGPVIEVVKGGLIVDIGLRGLPACVARRPPAGP